MVEEYRCVECGGRLKLEGYKINTETLGICLVLRCTVCDGVKLELMDVDWLVEDYCKRHSVMV